MRTGPRNLITDVAGLKVGNVGDPEHRTGVTVVMTDRRATAAVDVRGGAPGTRETDLLDPERTITGVDAIVLSGGSSFGLDAGAGAQALLREMGRGVEIGGITVPLAPTTILFDLLNGGAPHKTRYMPYREMGYAAAASAAEDFDLGSAGAGWGATTSTLRGGLGSASVVLENGTTVAALVAVNAVGSATIDGGRHFWAAPFEMDDEFGGHGLPDPMPKKAAMLVAKSISDPNEIGQNTSIGVIATDATLNKAEAKRLAVAAHDGLARALWPCHTVLDGDTVFALATGRAKTSAEIEDRLRLEAAAASTMSRAVARGVYLAQSSAGLAPMPPSWSDRFGS